MRADIVSDGLEVREDLLGLIDDLLVLQDGLVVRDVDRRGLGGVCRVDALGIGVAFAEGLEGRDGLWIDVEGTCRWTGKGKQGVVRLDSMTLRDVGRFIRGK